MFFEHLFAPFFALKPFGKNPRSRSTGLETGCNPVLLYLCWARLTDETTLVFELTGK